MKQFLFVIAAILFWACNSSSSGSGNGSAKANDYKAPSTAKANPNLENLDVTLQVAGVGAGGAQLIGIFTDQRFRADSAGVDATGKVRFKKDEPLDPGLYIALFHDNTSVTMLIDEDQTFSMTTQKQNISGAMKVEGNIENQLFYENAQFEAQLRPRMSANSQALRNTNQSSPQYQQLKEDQKKLIAERKAHLEGLYQKHPNSFFTVFKKAGQNPDIREVFNPDGSVDNASQVYFYRKDFWNDIDFSDERLLHTPVIANKLKRYISELTPQHPDSIVKVSTELIDRVLNHPEYFKYFANWVALTYDPQETTIMDPQAVYVNIVQRYFTNERAFWSDSVEVFGLQQRAYEMAASLVGKKGPDVISTDLNGNQRSIYEITAPYIVVYMYNPDCEHCQEQSPKLVEFYKEWKSKGVEVFAIAIDTEDDKWRNYAQKTGMTSFINVFDPTNKSIYAKYFVDVTPELYVLNPDRIIIGKNLKVDQISTIIERDKG